MAGTASRQQCRLTPNAWGCNRQVMIESGHRPAREARAPTIKRSGALNHTTELIDHRTTVEREQKRPRLQMKNHPTARRSYTTILLFITESIPEYTPLVRTEKPPADVTMTHLVLLLHGKRTPTV